MHSTKTVYNRNYAFSIYKFNIYYLIEIATTTDYCNCYSSIPNHNKVNEHDGTCYVEESLYNIIIIHA